MTEFDVALSKKASLARERLEHRFAIGEQEQRQLEKQIADMHIRDRFVAPKAMEFVPPKHGGAYFHYVPQGDSPLVRVHPHALGQLCKRGGMPQRFASRLIRGEAWERELFAHNMNELFHQPVFLDRRKNPAKFLHRLVISDPPELRGFLTRSFNRHIASLPLLRGFLTACGKVGAKSIEASSSAVRFSLKCYLPYVFEVVPGEHVAFGAVWSNSDFGAGILRVAMTTMRVSSGTLSVFEDTHHRRHITSIVEDDDLELSDDTAKKEVEAQVSAISDAVLALLSPDPVNKLLKAMTLAAEQQIPWHRLKSEIGQLLRKSELTQIQKVLTSNTHDIVDLPPPGKTEDGEPIATRWWAASTLGWMASKEQDPDRKESLQELSGDLLRVG